MSSNTYANGFAEDNYIIEFDKPVNHLNIYVSPDITFAISLDLGLNFMRLPAGFHSFRIGSVMAVHIDADGEWDLIGVQA